MTTEGCDWRVLVVGPPDLGQLGGTFLVAREVAKFSLNSTSPEVVSPETALAELAGDQLASSTLIFTIQEGKLSAEYEDWARKCLAFGATIIENNVFNLPSRYRPVHERYITGFNTEEGAERFVVRSGRSQKRRYFACSSVVNPPPADRPPVNRSSSLTMLRVGRPDPIKWTDWEVRFARRAAESLPNTDVVLTLIGVPDDVDTSVGDLGNLTIHRRENVPDISAEYAKSDVYLHFSAIGETFGNTVAEAMNSGMFVVCALEPSWDCAPLTFLNHDHSIVGTERWLEQHSSIVLDAIQYWRTSSDAGSIDLRAGRLGPSYVERLLNAADGDVGITPAWFAAAASLVQRLEVIRGVRMGWSAVFFEYLRGLRMRARQFG